MGKREDDRNKSLQNIMQTALELFAREGYHTTSMSKIAKAAGISKGLIYNYFDSKEGLLDAIVQQAMEIGQEAANRSYKEEIPEKVMRRLLDEFFSVVENDRQYWGFFFSLITQPGIMESIKEKMIDQIFESINQGTFVMEKLGSNKPKIDSYIFGAVCDGIFFHTMAKLDEYPLEEIKERLSEIFIHMIPKNDNQ